MSFRALAAVQDAEGVPSAMVACLLYVLAGHTGPDGTCFPSLKTIAKGMRCSVGGARNALREAEEAGLIEVRDRTRRDGGQTSNTIVLLYYMPEEPLDVHLAREAEQRAKNATPPTPDGGGAPAPAGGAPLHQMEGAPTRGGGAFLNQSDEPAGAYAPSAPARAPDSDPFDEFVRVMPAKCRKGPDWPRARKLWEAKASKFGADRLVAAARAYEADPDIRQQNFLPKLDTFLANEGFREFLPPAMTAVLPLEPGPPEFAAPPEVMDRLIGALGVAGAKSWLDGARFDDGRRVVICARPIAADKIRTAAGHELRDIGVGVEGPDAAQAELKL
jgi:hypothetical protein